jgi:hypothetical protein
VLGIDLVRLAIVLATIAAEAANAAIVAFALAARRKQGGEDLFTSGDSIMATMTLTIAALAFPAILYNGIPALIVRVCPS